MQTHWSQNICSPRYFHTYLNRVTSPIVHFKCFIAACRASAFLTKMHQGASYTILSFRSHLRISFVEAVKWDNFLYFFILPKNWCWQSVIFFSTFLSGSNCRIRKQNRPFRAETSGRGSGSAMGKKWESATVGGNGYRPENSDRTLHSLGQQTFPAPE